MRIDLQSCKFYFYQAIDIELSGVRERQNRDVSRLVPIILIDLYSQHQVIDVQDPSIAARLPRHIVPLLGVESGQIEAVNVDEKLAKFMMQPGELERRGCHG